MLKSLNDAEREILIEYLTGLPEERAERPDDAGEFFLAAPRCEFPPNGTMLNLIAMCRAAKAYGTN